MLLSNTFNSMRKLSKASVWLENLEGGIEYLRDVIINDKLGINAQLEADADKLISSYQCEWTTTLSNDDQLKRFSHFINSDERDSNVVFVSEREQHRPATEEEKAPIYNISVEEHA